MSFSLHECVHEMACEQSFSLAFRLCAYFASLYLSSIPRCVICSPQKKNNIHYIGGNWQRASDYNFIVCFAHFSVISIRREQRATQNIRHEGRRRSRRRRRMIIILRNGSFFCFRIIFMAHAIRMRCAFCSSSSTSQLLFLLQQNAFAWM